MVVEAVQNYVNLVSGLTRASRARATATARSVLAQAGLEGVTAEATERATRLADELVQASRANRELLENLVQGEVARAAGRWGFVRRDEVEALREEVAELRRTQVRATLAGSAHPPVRPRSTTRTVPRPMQRPGRPAPSAESPRRSWSAADSGTKQ